MLCLRYVCKDADGKNRDVGRTINSAATADAAMTNAKCVQFCYGKGFPYAGTGDATQPCGGPSRLTLYFTTAIQGPVVNPGVDGWASIGCYS